MVYAILQTHTDSSYGDTALRVFKQLEGCVGLLHGRLQHSSRQICAKMAQKSIAPCCVKKCHSLVLHFVVSIQVGTSRLASWLPELPCPAPPRPAPALFCHPKPESPCTPQTQHPDEPYAQALVFLARIFRVCSAFTFGCLLIPRVR